MAEYQDVMMAKVRMCNAHIASGCQDKDGNTCPLRDGICAKFTRDFTAEDIRLSEKIIVRWAEGNREPPTWRQYLTDIGVLPKPLILATDKYEMDFGSGFAEACALTNTHIPSELWEKIREAKNG